MFRKKKEHFLRVKKKTFSSCSEEHEEQLGVPKAPPLRGAGLDPPRLTERAAALCRGGWD